MTHQTSGSTNTPIIKVSNPTTNNNMLNQTTISINQGQHLSQVLPLIPTNTIVDKTITGCGATTLEINSPRYSLIIVPNLPVIQGKVSRHNFLLGVFEGVTVADIEKYIYDNESDGYLKIMTTPESFPKVAIAIRNTRIDMYKDFFLLFDECERAIQDVSFRKNIILPMEDFFKFDQKAMVSATPLNFLDPRFSEQKFQTLKVTPTFDYQTRLDLFATNNSLQTLYRVIERAEASSKTICVFFNSVNGITEIIELFKIADRSNIYCSEDKAKELKRLKAKNVFSDIVEVNNKAQLNSINFFTSRFYSAVDIELDYQPVVVALTELYSAPSSLIDPQTEAIQIFGRFRNGICSRIVITNINAQIEFDSQKECLKKLNEQATAYSKVCYLHENAQTKGAKDCYCQMLTSSDYARYAMPNGAPNFFMYNNALRTEYVKSLYRHDGRIKREYVDSKAFKVEFHAIEEKTTDYDRKELSMEKSKKEMNKVAYKQIEAFVNSRDKYDRMCLTRLAGSYSLMVDAYELLGGDKVKELDYDNTAIGAAVAAKKATMLKLEPGVVRAVYNEFNENTRYDTNFINLKLKTIFDKFKIEIKDKRGCARELALYFEMTENNTAKSRGYKLGGKLHEV